MNPRILAVEFRSSSFDDQCKLSSEDTHRIARQELGSLGPGLCQQACLLLYLLKMAHSLGACGLVISPFRGPESRARLSRAIASPRCTARSSAGSQQDQCTGPIHQLTALKAAAAGALLSACVLLAPPALADLNQAEAEIGGEFGIGTSKQYGEAEVSCGPANYIFGAS